MDNKYAEYRCEACERAFRTPLENMTIVTCCPYCTEPEQLRVTAMESALCDIEGLEDDYGLTPEQKEMVLYERAVDVLGLSTVSEKAIQALANLIAQLIEINAVLKSPDCTGMDYAEELAKLNKIKANAAISLNLLDVLFGSNPEEECRMLKELECSVDAADEAATTVTELKAKAATIPEDATT